MQFLRSSTRSLALLLVVLLTACTIEINLDNPVGTPTPRGGRTPTPQAAERPRTDSQRLGAVGVDLLVFPTDKVDVLVDLIGTARRRVFLKIYMFSEARIFEALEQAHAAGVDVRVQIEPKPLGGGTMANAAQTRLRKAGIEVKTTNPAFRLTHEKSYVIDDTAVILTANMTRGSFTRNREFAVVTRNPEDVAEIVQAFEADWNRAAFVPQNPNLVWSPDNSRTKIDALIEGAQKTLDVYAASTLDDEQLGLLAAAQKRGVKVRLMTSARGSGDGEDAAAGDLDRLQRARVKVRYLKSPLVHAKTFLADYGEPNVLGFVGSVNITTQSLDFNRELGILIADETALSRLQEQFEADWEKAVDR